MSSSSPAPKLPIWIFFATDAALLAAAIWIAKNTPHPMPELTAAAIVACIIAGAVAGLVPLVAMYERQKNETLDDRQRALEALARTISSSAEQISIAASGLHEIAEIAQRNLKHAEQLPHKLQEKIAEFQAQLANTNETEREELEKELEELRSSESERLQVVAERIAKTAADFIKIEAATHQHLTSANEAVSKLSFGTASAIGKAQVAAEQALAQTRQETARAIGEAEGRAVKAIDGAKTAAVAEITARLETGIAQLGATTAKVAALIDTFEKTVSSASITSSPTPEPVSATTAAGSSVDSAPEPAPATAATVEPSPETAHAPVKRSRKSRREEPVAPATPEVSSAPVSDHPTTPAAEAPSPASGGVAPEPAPILPETIAEVAPVAPDTAEPFAPSEPEGKAEPVTVTQREELPVSVTSVGTEPDQPAKPARKRGPKKNEDDHQPGLGLELEEPRENGEGTAGVVERVLSSDGATRLIVTAYIGIGNRLFIRGQGPGLSWEKGVPLQFVSIGKWRWETNEANGPVEFKLFKNDEQESAGLGALTIDPGHQHEVTANF